MQVYKSTLKIFSFVELLIVIAVISVLFSLINPSLNKLVESANTMSCRNNLKNIFIGTSNWSEANDDWIIPSNWRGNYDLWDHIGGSRSVMPESFICQSFFDPTDNKIRATYGVNAYALLHENKNPGDPIKRDPGNGLWGANYDQWGKHGLIKLSTLRNPSDTMYFMDIDYFLVAWWNYPFENINRNYLSRWHRNSIGPFVSNFLMFDGSVDYEPEDVEYNWRKYLFKN